METSDFFRGLHKFNIMFFPVLGNYYFKVFFNLTGKFVRGQNISKYPD